MYRKRLKQKKKQVLSDASTSREERALKTKMDAGRGGAHL